MGAIAGPVASLQLLTSCKAGSELQTALTAIEHHLRNGRAKTLQRTEYTAWLLAVLRVATGKLGPNAKAHATLAHQLVELAGTVCTRLCSAVPTDAGELIRYMYAWIKSLTQYGYFSAAVRHCWELHALLTAVKDSAMTMCLEDYFIGVMLNIVICTAELGQQNDQVSAGGLQQLNHTVCQALAFLR